MTDFLVILLALTQIPIIFIYSTKNLNHFLGQKTININSIWLKQHAEFTNHIALAKIFKYFSSSLAIASLIAIIYYGFNMSDSDRLLALLLAPNFIWIGGFGIYMMLFQFLVTKRIPTPEIRSASMNNRQLRNYLPMWLIYLAYGLLALIFTIYIWAYFSQTITAELLTRRLTGLGIFIITMSLITYKSFKNKVSEFTFIFGQNGRKIEAIINCGLLYTSSLLGIVLILSDIFGIVIFTPLSFVLVAHLCVQIYLITLFFHAKGKNIYQTS